MATDGRIVSGRRFGVFRIEVTVREMEQAHLRGLVARLREGNPSSEVCAQAARRLEELAAHPDLLKMRGLRERRPDKEWFVACHAVLCEKLGDRKLRIGGHRERVAAFWRLSVETVQDALTNRRADAEIEMSAAIGHWSGQGFSAAEIVASFERTLFANTRDRIKRELRERGERRERKENKTRRKT
jgi:hypothetical protein